VVDLRPSNPVPLYYQLAESITRAIRIGVLRPGMSLGHVGELAEQLRISRNTVRHAMNLLDAAHVVRSVNGCHIVVGVPRDGPDDVPGDTGERAAALSRPIRATPDEARD
jgi:DNA-binding FadR family transcriptional regulator